MLQLYHAWCQKPLVAGQCCVCHVQSTQPTQYLCSTRCHKQFDLLLQLGNGGMKRLLEADAVDQLDDDLVLALLDVSYPRREDDATQFRDLARWRTYGERYRRLIDERLYPAMQGLPRAFSVKINTRVLRMFPGLRRVSLKDNTIRTINQRSYARVPSHILAQITALESVELVDDYAIEASALNGLTRLTELRLVGRTLVGASNNAVLPNSLRHLALIEHRESRSHLLVSGLTQLDTLVYSEYARGQHIGAWRRPVQDTFGPHSIPGLTNLTSLTLACETWDEWPLAQLTALQSLNLHNYAKVDERELIALPALTRLQVTNSMHGRTVSRLTRLVSLELDNNNNHIRYYDLLGLTRLRELVLRGATSVFFSDDKALLLQRLPDLRIIKKAYEGRALTQ